MESSTNQETLIFGQKQKPVNQTETQNPDAGNEPKPTVTDAADTQKPKETSTQNNVEEQQQQKPKGETQNQTQTEKPSEKGDENKPQPKDEIKKPSLKIDFGGNTNDNEAKPNQQSNEVTRAVTENDVIDFLKKQGLDISKISEVSKKVTLNEEVAKFQKYNEETGRGISDFYNLQKDWNKVSKEERIKSYLRVKHPNLSDEDIQNQFDLISVTEEDEDNLSERELKKARLEFSKLDSEALSFLSQKSKEYAVPLGQAHQHKAPTAEDIAKAHQPYWTARDNSLKKLNEISFNIDGVGEIKLSVDEDDKKFITHNTETVDSFIQRWQNGDSLDTERLVEDTLWSNPSSRQKLIQSIVEQVHALTLDNFSKQNRNVNLDGQPPKQTPTEKNSGLIIEGGSPQRDKDSKFGKSILK